MELNLQNDVIRIHPDKCSNVLLGVHPLNLSITMTKGTEPVVLTETNAVVTPLRKAASYEQRKTNLGNQISAPYYHVVPRIMQH